MEYTVLIDTTAGMTRAALMDTDGRLCELCIDPHKKNNHEAEAIVNGAIYKARVVNVLPALDAAFVDLGTGPNALLHGFSLPKTLSKIRQPLAAVLRENSEIMVEIKRPGYAAKGPKVSADIGLNGRLMILLPYTSKTFTSQKLPPQERRRLEVESQMLSPRGKILRTGAAKAGIEALQAEEQALINRWRGIEAAAAKTPAPCLLYCPDIIWYALENWLSRLEIKEFICNDEAFIQKLRTAWPEYGHNIRLFHPRWSFFATYNIENQLEQAVKPLVTLTSGATLVIEPTESMTVIDVNSGKSKAENFDETALKVNLAAAVEIARQIRLRCIGGLIVVDFIDMYLDEHRAQVLKAFKNAFKDDLNRVEVAGFTESGVLTLKRSRSQRPWQSFYTQKCGCCNCGHTISPRYYAQKIYREILDTAETGNKQLWLTLHPAIAEFYLEKGKPLLVEIERLLQTTICVESDSKLTPAAYLIRQSTSII